MEVMKLLDRRAVIYAVWIGFIISIIANAWVSEDAYITLRVVDNFFHGYGLRWNINERVQVYTHPLWLLLHIPIGLLVSNLYWVSIILSVLCAGAAIFVTLNTVRQPLLITLACLFVPMWKSKAFMDYATSGLESPLCYLLLACFGYVMIKKQGHPHFWFLCSLTVALALFTRLDTILLYAPTLVWLVCARFKEVRWGQVALGALPLAGWFLFSFWYYGFFFPNTKYAKLDTGLDTIRYLRNGWHYTHYMLLMDIVSSLSIISSVVFIFTALRTPSGKQIAIHVFPLCMALGIWWYIAYVIAIGGDYMIGRFWALPVFAAIWLAYIFIPPNFNPKILYGLIILLVIMGDGSPIMKSLRKQCKPCVVPTGHMIDARWMFGGNKLIAKLVPFRLNDDAHHKFVRWGKKIATLPTPHVEKAHYIGMLGFYAGPGATLVDELGLGDALLSRLPVTETRDFYTGHYRRTVPAGYMDAVRTGSTARMDPSLAQYYEKLKLITSGDLMDTERLVTIVEFNLGAYDHWKQDYLACNVW